MYLIQVAEFYWNTKLDYRAADDVFRKGADMLANVGEPDLE